jgi:hypothetical protein
MIFTALFGADAGGAASKEANAEREGGNSTE